jgi:hypothetical protein
MRRVISLGEGFKSKKGAFLFVLILACLVLYILIIGNEQTITSPTVGEGTTQPKLVWSISDHDSVGNALRNDLNENTQPDYSNPGVVIELPRNPDGSVNMLRYQGRLTYTYP